MNREIKFRAWNSKKNKMEIDVYKEYDDLMQYTGLKDNNGKEIYEGDIVKITYGLSKAIIGFSKGAFIMYNGNSNIYLLYDNFIENGIMGNWEVVGNIYEKPELLKECDNNE